MSKACVFCATTTKLTREHVIPRFLYELIKPDKVGFNIKANKHVESEHLIKDVCATCNNDYLSKLDKYGKEFYLKNNLNLFHLANQNIIVKYDYKLLTRFLLKIAYNTSRATDIYPEVFDNLKEYILTGKSTARIKFYLEIISKYKIRPEDKQLNNEYLRNNEYLGHDILRTGIAVQSGFNYLQILRFVSINSYFFYILFFLSHRKRHEMKDDLTTFEKLRPDSVKLSFNKSQLNLKVSRRDTIDFLKDQVVFTEPQWNDYIENKKS